MSTAEEIPALSYILEPLLVAGLLTAGCLINHRPGRLQNIVHASKLLSQARPDYLPTFFKKQVPVPNTERFRRNITSRFLAYFPFLLEVWYWLLTYWVYQIARALQALSMGDNTRSLSEAHARTILAIESALGLDIEKALQELVMKSDMILIFFNKTYAMVHIPATISYIGYSYWAFPPAVFQRVRRTLVLCNCLAFIIFSSWPCMPPRLLPFEEFGYIDTVHRGEAASIWTTNKFQNQLAAFPSLHFGYSFVIGLALFLYSPHRPVRWVALGYPVLILLIIMATANHYLLDAVGGFFVTVVAYKINHLLLYLRPLEEWGMWLCRTEKPLDKALFEQALAEYTSTVSENGGGAHDQVHLLDEESFRRD
ncbi:hypothetical protein NCC49_004975 [Naganishia albida]|nr:hypothetical protein NCC49_004975 [Naganishia albida]